MAHLEILQSPRWPPGGSDALEPLTYVALSGGPAGLFRFVSDPPDGLPIML